MFNFNRVLARLFDYSVFFLILGSITLFLPYFYGPYFYYFLALSIPLLWVPCEAFFLSKWKATFGKALFRLAVQNKKGGTLSYSEAFRWSFGLSCPSVELKQKPFSFKRKLFAMVASIGFVVAAIYGNVLALWSVGLENGISPTGWVEYASDDARFKVSFPTDPELAFKELETPDGRILSYKEVTSASGEKVYYSLSHMDLPRKWRLASNTTLLKSVLDLLVKQNENGALLEKQFATHRDHRVLDYRLQKGTDEEKGRLIIVNGTLYKLTIVCPQTYVANLEGNPFLNSFEIS